MPRPTEYEDERVDTKVRLRPDHARLLREASQERGLGRNRLIELALDLFFDLKTTGPRLLKTPKDPNLVQGGPRKPTRVSRRLLSPGEAMEGQSASRTPRNAP